MKLIQILLTAMVLTACQSAEDREREAWLTKVRASLDNQLPDYGSTRFRNVHISDAKSLCGELNAMNRMGGYSGWTPFIAVGPEAIILEGESVDAQPCPGAFPGYLTEDFASAFQPK